MQLSDFKRTITINNYHAMINMLKHTDAFIFGNRWQADELRKGSVATLPLEGVDIAVSLFWSSGKRAFVGRGAVLLDLLRKNYGFM